LPLGGLTAFGFKGKLAGGLVGHFYALDQMADGQDSDIVSEGQITDPYEVRQETAKKIYAWMDGFYQNFFKNNCDESILQKYKMGKELITAFQIRILPVGSHDTPPIFNYSPNEKNKFSLMREGSWVVLYKGTVVAPMSGEFRFTGQGNDLLAVRFDNKLVFGTGSYLGNLDKDKAIFGEEYFSRCKHRDLKLLRDLDAGIWIKVETGKAYPMEVIISKNPGGFAFFSLEIEERSPPKPYPPRTDPSGNPASYPHQLSYPLFQTRKGVPIPPPNSMMPSLAPDPVVFPGK